MVTALYAALLGLIQVFLTFKVVGQRRAQRVSLGTEKGDEELLRSVRAHGNFTEIVPISLVLLILVELQGGPLWAVHTLGGALILGRVLHLKSILKAPFSISNGRVIGMVLSLTVILISAGLNLWLVWLSL